MKMYATLIITMVISLQGNAQIDKIVGDWIEVRHIQIDTIDSGHELINKDVKAYLNGYKKLDAEYTSLRDVEPNEEQKLRLSITKEHDHFWATDGKNFNQKIIYDAQYKKHKITIPGYRTNLMLIVKYDKKNKKLVFIDAFGYQYKFYEFVRKE